MEDGSTEKETQANTNDVCYVSVTSKSVEGLVEGRGGGEGGGTSDQVCLL